MLAEQMKKTVPGFFPLFLLHKSRPRQHSRRKPSNRGRLMANSRSLLLEDSADISDMRNLGLYMILMN